MRPFQELFASLSQLSGNLDYLIKGTLAQEVFTTTLFVIGFFALVGWFGWLLFKYGYSWVRAKKLSINLRDRIGLVSGVIALTCLAYAYWVEPGQVEIVHIRIDTNKLAYRIRVVQVSDLHSEVKPRLELKLASLIRQEKPDLIVFTGDAINDQGALPVFRQCMRELSSIAPTFAVWGNHDSRQWRFAKLYAGTNVQTLDGDSRLLSFHGSKIWLGGVAVDDERKAPALLGSVPADVFSVFLYHFPSGAYLAARAKVNLFCTGHTHGGQVRLPFYGALVTRSSLGKKFESGMYQVDKTLVYVNRGLGEEGGLAPRLRFLCPPEITVFDLVPS